MNQSVPFRYISSVVFLLCLVTAGAAAQPTSDSALIRVGSVMTYAIESKGKHYDFVITLKRLDSVVAFDWQIPEPVGKHGSVSISAAAMQSAMTHYNQFPEGEVSLDDQTSVFISSKMFSLLTEKKPVEVYTNGPGTEPVTFKIVNAIVAVPCLVDGKRIKLNVIPMAEASSGKSMVVLNDPNHPFIIRMNIGFKVKLQSIAN